MPLPKLRTSGVQGVGLIAVTYVYFLIFAQFAFIHRLDTLGIAGDHLKFVMAAMAIGGILLSLLAPRVSFLPSPARRLQLAFCLAGIAAFLDHFSTHRRRCDSRIHAHRRSTRPAHRHPRHASSPVDRQSQRAPQSRPRHRHRLFPLQRSIALHRDSSSPVRDRRPALPRRNHPRELHRRNIH